MSLYIGLLLTIAIVIEVRCPAVAECCLNEQENLYTLFIENQFNDKCL